MKLLRSLALSVLFPESRHKADAFADTINYLEKYNLDSVEFFYEGDDKKRVAGCLSEAGLKSIYIAVIPLKGNNLSLCSLNEVERMAAVNLTKHCIDDAYLFGSISVMINSGRHPGDDPEKINEGIAQFIRSVDELQLYIDEKESEIFSDTSAKSKTVRKPMNLLLEPCDSHMDARNLLGPGHLVYKTAAALKAKYKDFGLTMDTAHVSEQGENFLEEMKKAKSYCNHVHFANCVTENTSDPMYGDKHVGFEYTGSDFPPARLIEIFQALKELYKGEELRIAIEILCREEDPKRYMEKIALQIPWFFN